jgi:hypothetical protein
MMRSSSLGALEPVVPAAALMVVEYSRIFT